MEHITLEDISEAHFGGCKTKYLKEVDYTTPDGHDVKALICRKANRYLGSLFILSVDGVPTGQFVASMPKLHYLDNYHTLDLSKWDNIHFGYEKLDGTCVILYALLDGNGDVIEVVPKSRNMGVLDKNFQKLYDECDTKKYEDWIIGHPNYSLLFELYGMGNPHSIKHMDTYLDLCYLGAVNANGLVRLGVNPYFNKPPQLFTIEQGVRTKVAVNRRGFIAEYGAYGFDSTDWYYNYDSVEDAINGIKEDLQRLNESYYKVNNRLALEGVVFHGTNPDGETIYIKVKPDAIEREHKSQNGIPRQYIMKEIMKYLDEYGSTAKQTFEENPEEIWDYLNRNLAEEFEPEWIEKSQSKMKRWFEKKLYPAATPEEIIEIGDKLMSEYPNRSVVDYMRLFGQQYPEQKKQGGKLHQYLTDKLDGDVVV